MVRRPLAGSRLEQWSFFVTEYFHTGTLEHGIGNGCLLEPEPSRVLASRLVGVGAAGEIEGETGRVLSQEEFFPPACQPVSPQPILIVRPDISLPLEPGDQFFAVASADA